MGDAGVQGKLGTMEILATLKAKKRTGDNWIIVLKGRTYPSGLRLESKRCETGLLSATLLATAIVGSLIIENV